MKLEYLMTYHADLEPGVPVGKGPFGTRTIVDVTGGTFEGPKLRGKLLRSGADWLLADDSGGSRLDVRATFETHDGARIYVQYFGVLEFGEKVQQALAGGAGTDFGDVYFMTQPRFETGDARYAWLNRVVAVGEGRVLPGAVEYRVFHVMND
jgi:hypothetical protein